MYNYSSQLESGRVSAWSTFNLSVNSDISSSSLTGHFVGRRADYLFMLIFNWACLVLVGLCTDLMVRFAKNIGLFVLQLRACVAIMFVAVTDGPDGS